MAVLTVTTISRAGHNVDTIDVAADVAGDSFPNTGDELVIFNNTDAATRVVTFVFQATLDGQAATARTITVPATSGKMIVGPFPTSIYNDSNGRMNMTYSAVAGLTVMVFKRGQ